MGRLLDALRADAENGQAAIPAIPAIPAIRQVHRLERIAESRESQRVPIPESGAARLLAAIRAEGLPDELLRRDDATAEQLSELTDAGLRAYAQALHCTAERTAGRIPTGWHHAAHCDGCGPVWLWTPGRVTACPWCWNRRALKPIPRPKVRCDDCAHFIRDEVNPPAGVGACSAGRGRPGPSLWPMAFRVCGSHCPKEFEHG